MGVAVDFLIEEAEGVLLSFYCFFFQDVVVFLEMWHLQHLCHLGPTQIAGRLDTPVTLQLLLRGDCG